MTFRSVMLWKIAPAFRYVPGTRKFGDTISTFRIQRRHRTATAELAHFELKENRRNKKIEYGGTLGGPRIRRMVRTL